MPGRSIAVPAYVRPPSRRGFMPWVIISMRPRRHTRAAGCTRSPCRRPRGRRSLNRRTGSSMAPLLVARQRLALLAGGDERPVPAADRTGDPRRLEPRDMTSEPAISGTVDPVSGGLIGGRRGRSSGLRVPPGRPECRTRRSAAGPCTQREMRSSPPAQKRSRWPERARGATDPAMAGRGSLWRP